MPPPPSFSLARWRPLPAQLAVAVPPSVRPSDRARGCGVSPAASPHPMGPTVFKRAMGKRYIISRGGGRDLSPEVKEPSLKSGPTRGASGQPNPRSP